MVYAFRFALRLHKVLRPLFLPLGAEQPGREHVGDGPFEALGRFTESSADLLQPLTGGHGDRGQPKPGAGATGRRAVAHPAAVLAEGEERSGNEPVD